MLPKGNCSTDLCFLSRPLSLAGAGVSVFFVTTKVLSRQKYVCHDKHSSVATTLSSQPTGVCRAFVATKVCLLLQNSCHNKHYFVVTSILLSWQKTCFVFVATNTGLLQQNFCRICDSDWMPVALHSAFGKSTKVTEVLLSRYMVGAMWNCCRLGASSV